MGRRSINTTKSGKYMNPTDQAREFSFHFSPLISFVFVHWDSEQMFLHGPFSIFFRQRGEEAGTQEEQEAAHGSAHRCPQEQGSHADFARVGTDRPNGCE
jgi:hypothetical protein